VINRKGLVFIGRRADGPEHIDKTHVWQMPQGGIDEGEKPYPAALRELYEETSIKSVEKLGEIRNWLTYDIPKKIGTKGLEGKNTRGQKQKWYAMRFTGKDKEINIENPRRRTPSGVHRLALGADGKPSRSGGAVQARDLPAGGDGVLPNSPNDLRHAQIKNAARRPRFFMSAVRRRSMHRRALQMRVKRLEVIELGDLAIERRTLDLRAALFHCRNLGLQGGTIDLFERKSPHRPAR